MQCGNARQGSPGGMNHTNESRITNQGDAVLPRRRPVLLSLAIAMGAAWAAPARAQAGPDESAQPTQLEEVNVTGRRDFEDRFTSSASRLTISRRDIEAMGANSIGDILRQTPGLQVTTTANGGLEIRMRGMGTESTRILVDGVPASTNNRTAQLPLDELPADLIERIEVLRAPSAEYQGAAGGTLNIVLRGASPRKETFVWLNDQYVWGRHAPFLFASQTGPLGAASEKPLQGAAQESWSYFISINAGERNPGSNTTRDTAANTVLPTASTIDNDVRLRNRLLTITPRLTGRLGAHDRLTLRGTFSAIDQDGRVLTNSNGLLNGATLASTSQNPWRYDRLFYQGAMDWSHSFADAKWDTTAQLERSRSENRSNRDALSTLAGVATPQTSGHDEDRAERGLIVRSKLATGFGDAVWTVGAELELRKLDVWSVSSAAGVATPLDSDATSRRKTLWTQYELPLESVKTSATLGLRAQDFTVNATAAGVPSRYHDLAWQPSLNTRTALTDNLQYRVNLARIARNPRVWELAPVNQPNLSANSPNEPDYRGNPGLRPESTVTFDTGIERRLAEGGQAGLNLFVRKQSNLIRRRLSLVGARWVEQPDNIGRALVWGLETDVRTNLAWAGLGRDWNMSANASLLNSRMSESALPDMRVPGQPRYLANLNIAKPLRQSGGWYGGGTLTLHGASDLGTVSGPGVVTTGRQRAHTQLDLYVGSVIPRVGFWRLNVNNITDYRQQRERTVSDATAGSVFSEESERRLTPRLLLTVGTRF